MLILAWYVIKNTDMQGFYLKKIIDCSTYIFILKTMKIMGNCFQVSNFVIIVITADYSGNILFDNSVPPLCFNNHPILNLAPFSL